MPNKTATVRRQTPVEKKRFSRKELAYVLDQKEQYKWIKEFTTIMDKSNQHQQ